MSQMHEDIDNDAGRMFEVVPQAPGALHASILRELHRRRLLRRPLARAARIAGAAAILVAVLSAGYFRPFAPAQAATPTHLLLLYEDQAYRAPPAGAEQVRVMEYTAWARQLVKEDKLVNAAGLAAESPLAVKGGAPASHDEAGKLGRLTGFFLISADDAREADRIAGQCPHLKYGGRVVIRTLAEHGSPQR